MECLYCKSKNLVKIVLRSVRCLDCYSLTCLDSEPLYNSYDLDYHAYKFSFFRPKFWVLGRKALNCGIGLNNRYIKKSRLRVLDIGCGAGHALWWAKNLGYNAFGLDMPWVKKPKFLEDYRYYTDINKLQKDFEKAFNIVWCWHTLEHSEKPKEFLKKIKSLVKPGGKLYLEIPESTLLLNGFEKEEIYKAASFPEHRGIPSKVWISKMLDNGKLKLTKPKEGRMIYLQFGKPEFHLRFEWTKPI
ncbi:MAG: class I SAM-dependent methyltransferase [Nanoarchaeota archaeon]